MTACEKETTELERALGFSLAEIGEDLSEAEAQEMNLTIERLNRYTVALPDKGETTNLLKSIQQCVMAARAPARFRQLMERPSGREAIGLLNLIRPQISLLGKPFWLTGVLICCVGACFIDAIGDRQMIPLIMAAPLLAAVSTVFAFQNSDERVLELENSAALSWQQLTLARLCIVLAVDCLSLSLISLLAVGMTPGWSFWLLLLSWFAPLLLWASLAFGLSLRYGHLVGLLVACAAWGLQIVARVTYPQFDLLRVAATETDVLVRLGMMALASVILAVSIHQTGKGGRWIAARLLH